MTLCSGHPVSKDGLEVGKAKVFTIGTLVSPTTVSFFYFLGYFLINFLLSCFCVLCIQFYKINKSKLRF